jgi:two-component system sensor histidine kinase BaeS
MRTGTIARQLSAAYTRDNGWSSISFEVQRLNNLEKLNPEEDPVLRIIVRDMQGKTIYNSFSNITQIENVALIEGKSQPVINYTTTNPVGIVTVYISQSYITEYAQEYAAELLKSGTYKALLTAAAAIIISLLFSRRITRPLIQLTNSARSIAEGEDSRQIDFKSSDEIGQLSNAFNSMITALKTQRDLRKRLLSDVSHQINTPLNSIRLEARGLSDRLVSAEEAGLNIIREIDSLKNIIYDLDWLAESDSGAYHLKLEEHRISKIISEELTGWKQTAETRGILLKNAVCSDNIPLVKVDAVRIGAAIGNLIDNALKYSPRGSIVTVGCTKKENWITVSVCDNGPAIAAEYRQHIFERFYRLENSIGPAPPGRGLGLAIVKQIAELHHGKVRLECGDKTGNCFLLSLPANMLRKPRTL